MHEKQKNATIIQSGYELCRVAPTCFGITGSVRSAFWETLSWGAVDRILRMGVLCLVTWRTHWDRQITVSGSYRMGGGIHGLMKRWVNWRKDKCIEVRWLNLWKCGRMDRLYCEWPVEGRTVGSSTHERLAGRSDGSLDRRMVLGMEGLMDEVVDSWMNCMEFFGSLYRTITIHIEL
jgi:hypothetical protein